MDMNPSLKHPGITLRDFLDDIGMTQADLALRMGRPRKTINEIIQGKARITPETALQLEIVLVKQTGQRAEFWLKEEYYYRLRLARAAQRKMKKHV